MKRRWDKQYAERNHISKQKLRDNPARFKKESKINFGKEETQIKIEEGKILSNTNKWITKMKVNLLKIEERERNRGLRFLKKVKEAWNDIYQNSTMSKKTVRDNTAKFCKDNSSLNLIKIRYRNDAEPEAIYLTLFRLRPKRVGSKKPPYQFFPSKFFKVAISPQKFSF